MTPPIRLAIIIGSTREGRFGERVARWFTNVVQTRTDFVIDLIDLAEMRLPDVMAADAGTEVKLFRKHIDQADAFVVVTPEYNHAYPAPLKSAIDYANSEWHAKPVGFVSYGGISGGLRAVEQLRQVFAELHAMTVRDTVSFHGAFGQIDEAGNLNDAERAEKAANVMLDRLKWWATALREARFTEEYAA